MVTAAEDFLGAVEMHSVDRLRALLDGGLNVNRGINGKIRSIGSSKCTRGQTGSPPAFESL